MFDRLLLILLILLLPLGVVASRFISGEVNVGKTTSEEQEKKIETLINNLTQKANQTTEKSTINVTGIVYASESGKLRVAGISKELQANFWVWWAGNKKNNDSKSASGSATTLAFEGPRVFRPGTGGSFNIEIEASEYSGILEIRIEQDKQNIVLRYDTEKKKQLLD